MWQEEPFIYSTALIVFFFLLCKARFYFCFCCYCCSSTTSYRAISSTIYLMAFWLLWCPYSGYKRIFTNFFTFLYCLYFFVYYTLDCPQSIYFCCPHQPFGYNILSSNFSSNLNTMGVHWSKYRFSFIKIKFLKYNTSFQRITKCMTLFWPS